MTTQDKGAPIENPVAEIGKFLANAPKLFADEIARLRKENEALRGALADLARMKAEAWGSGVSKCVMLSPDGEASVRAFKILGWPNPCPKEKAK